MSARRSFIQAFCALVPLTVAGQETTSVPRPACQVSAGTPRRLELADGNIVSVDFRSFARSGPTVMAVGRFAYVFAKSAGSRSLPLMRDSIIGVTIDDQGSVSVVPSPLRSVMIHHPRVAPAPNGRFHAVWVTGLDSATGPVDPGDTTTLWYATYGNGHWSTPETVARFRGTKFEPEFGSALLENDGELALLVAFQNWRPPESDGGAILLRRRGITWSADTLRTRSVPGSVTAQYGTTGIIALFTQRDGDGSSSLHFSRFDERWSRPTLLARHERALVALPDVVVRDSDYVISWIDWRPMDSETSTLHAMVVDAVGRPVTQLRVDSGAATVPYGLILAGRRHPVWLYRGSPPGALVAVAVHNDSTVMRLPSLAIPFSNPVPSTLALSEHRLLLFTQKLALTDADPMAASYVTELEFRCPATGRR